MDPFIQHVSIPDDSSSCVIEMLFFQVYMLDRLCLRLSVDSIPSLRHYLLTAAQRL
jgi:hypothetical protein